MNKPIKCKWGPVRFTWWGLLAPTTLLASQSTSQLCHAVVELASFSPDHLCFYSCGLLTCLSASLLPLQLP